MVFSSRRISTFYTVRMKIMAAVTILFTFAVLSTLPLSAQAPRQPSKKPAITYPDTVDGLHDFLANFVQSIKTADLENRARMEESLHLPKPKEWFTSIYGPTLGPKLANDYIPELYPYLDGQDLGPSMKVRINRVQFATRRAAQSSDIPVFRFMVHSVHYYTAYLSWSNDDNIEVIYPLFVYDQGSFRTIKRQFGEIDDRDRPHCGLQRLLLHRFTVGGEIMKQRLLSPHHALPLPPGTGQASTLAVKLLLKVGCDGSVLETDYVDGPPELFKAANEVARKWKYGQTFMNGVPSEVDTTATVAFGTSE